MSCGYQSLEFKKRLGIYKTKTGKNTFDPVKVEGDSYGHWLYIRKINDKVVFNNYRYSSTTSGHQWTGRQLLTKLGIKIDLEIECRTGLQHFENDVLEPLYKILFDNEIKANKKHGSKNNKAKYLSIVDDTKSKIDLCKKLGARISQDDIDHIKRQRLQIEADRLAELKNVAKISSETKAKFNDLSPVKFTELNTNI